LDREYPFPARIYRSGGSLVVTIPRDIVEMARLRPGQRVYVIIKIMEG